MTGMCRVCVAFAEMIGMVRTIANHFSDCHTETHRRRARVPSKMTGASRSVSAIANPLCNPPPSDTGLTCSHCHIGTYKKPALVARTVRSSASAPA